MPRQEQHIPRSLAQRRHLNRKHIQPVIQILSKRPILHRYTKRPIGRCNHAHIHSDLITTPHGTNASLLQNTQQTHLHIQRHIPDLIQKQRTPI